MNDNRRIWTMPLLLAALIMFGLLSALLGTGVWHGLAWIALAIPIVVALSVALKRRRR
jgi:hypothetical protein